ncbi:DNA-binding transcriptional regulator YhcF, GntR family [Ruminococcus sp. YE71]|uniref:GntR family transcriptional regulator n=1 Tax=unclassified Ruminococcus TaxID=2608920 RepID=UPI00088C98BE|nr:MULTISPECIES: GntR family transcriptional regulator [unclassified Ruminococcus]SDA22247.1 DNA-binding transcriptional regulator YhcF, GntR family [Ruminococcus sp. YE78]SFW37701.1 DNA-binding transcriptional regulator YhcF, GntR family [Ruminococcus sp. YE71]
MKFKLSGHEPIYAQLVRYYEDLIISRELPEEGRLPSTNEVAAAFGVNPATVLKAMEQLVAKNIVYKKRGLGMFVCSGACWQLTEERRSDFYENHVRRMLEEAHRIGFTNQDIIDLINASDSTHMNF